MTNFRANLLRKEIMQSPKLRDQFLSESTEEPKDAYISR